MTQSLYLSFNFGRSSSPVLIIKLVVEALDVARAHILPVQLLDLELECVFKTEIDRGNQKWWLFLREVSPLAWHREQSQRQHWQNRQAFRLAPCWLSPAEKVLIITCRKNLSDWRFSSKHRGKPAGGPLGTLLGSMFCRLSIRHQQSFIIILEPS